jgi:GAF domain-containing protein
MAVERERAIIDSFISFTDRLVDDFDVVDLTIQLTEDCVRLLGVAAAGLLLADVGVLHLVAATSEQARSLELFQLQREQGPCLDCYRAGCPVSVPDLQAEADRWPRFTAEAITQGFASVHAIPMRLRDQVLGALGLFGTSRGELTDDDLALAQALAHVASIAVVQHDRAANRVHLLGTLQSTVASRGLLEMAKGILAEVYQLSMAQAALRLRHYAHRHGHRLTDVARTVVAGDLPARQQLLAELGASTSPPPVQ